MDKRCTVCNHSQAHDINLALLAGTTLDILKQQFGLSRSALHRHKQHLKCTLDRAEDRMRNNFLLSYLFQLNDYNAAAAATVAAARSEGNTRLTLQAANAGTRIINTMARFEIDLDHETSYRLMTSPDYVQPGCLLPGNPQILAGPREALVRSLAAACPETALGELFDPEDVAASRKLAPEPDANTPLPHPRQLELPGFLVPLDDVLPAGPEPTAPHAGPCSSDPYSLFPDPCLSEPEPKRDRSGTEAGQTPPLYEFIEENQMEMQKEKITGTDPDADSLPSAYCPLPTTPCGPEPTEPPVNPKKVVSHFSKPTGGKRKIVSDLYPGPAPQSNWVSSMCSDPDTSYEEYLAETAALGINVPEEPLEPKLAENNPTINPSSLIPDPCPPKRLPYRHRYEDFRSNSIFGYPGKIFG
jgi:hypothetical protein